MHLPNTLIGPINTHKMAHSTPSMDKHKKPLLLLLLLPLRTAPATPLPPPPLKLLVLPFNLSRLKLDIRSKARFTNGLSEADAGVVGIDSTNAHKEEENQLELPPFSWPIWF